MSNRSVLDWARKAIALPFYIFGIGVFALGYYVIRISEVIEGRDEINIPQIVKGE